MFHYGRCGSTVVTDLVGQHPDVFWDGEVFQEMFRGRLPEQRLTRHPSRLLRLRRLRAGHRFYGFETKFHPAYHLGAAVLDMEPAELVERLERLGFENFIVLERRNYLRQQISEEVGRRRGRVWHQAAGSRPVLHPIVLDVDRVRFGGWRLPLIASFEERDRLYEIQKDLLRGTRHLWMTYEQDVRDDPRIGYRRIVELLGLRPQDDVRILRSRTNPFPLRKILQNFDEVSAALRGTSYEWMLEDEVS